MPNRQSTANHWSEGVAELFVRERIRQIPYVPDAGHTQLINLCHAHEELNATPLTTEEEGVAQLCGAWLGGQRGALLLQSSGVGNCINMLAMVNECRFPLLMLVTMRGDWGEFNPWQIPMGRATPGVLHEMGVLVEKVDAPDRVVETVHACARIAFSTNRAAAVLIGQRVVGIKRWD
jgi:sulfopyruvate decarboxylase alpha subunit